MFSLKLITYRLFAYWELKSKRKCTLFIIFAVFDLVLIIVSVTKSLTVSASKFMSVCFVFVPAGGFHRASLDLPALSAASLCSPLSARNAIQVSLQNERNPLSPALLCAGASLLPLPSGPFAVLLVCCR